MPASPRKGKLERNGKPVAKPVKKRVAMAERARRKRGKSGVEKAQGAGRVRRHGPKKRQEAASTVPKPKSGAPDRPWRSSKKGRRPLRDRTAPARRKVGRPSKYTEAIAGAIFEAVESGMSPTAAGALHKLHAQTISDWRTQIPEFSDGIEQARARGIQKRLEEVSAGVNLAGLRDWKASAWLLERLDREHFGRGPGVSVQVSANAEAGAQSVSGFVLSEAELGEIQARRAAALRGTAAEEVTAKDTKDTKNLEGKQHV